jgi:hypothetical protein
MQSHENSLHSGIINVRRCGAAIQGLHAQAKLKAYSVAELETFNVEAQKTYLPAAHKAIEEAHGRAFTS